MNQQAGGYVGVNYAALESEVGSLGIDTPAMMINAGYQINPVIALEGRFGFGVNSYILEIDNYFGGFVRIGAPAHQRFYPYAMLGYGRTEVSVSSRTISVSGIDNDFAYGIGANIGFTDNFFGKIEYMNYYDESGFSVNGFTIGTEITY